MTPLNHRMLCEACTAAGVELGACDHAILTWLAGYEPQACAVIAGLIQPRRSGTGQCGMTAILRAPRRTALAAIAVLVATASAVSFAESYRGLWLWAHGQELSGTWAVIWPLQIDVFIAVGELALFVALADRWPARHRVGRHCDWARGLGGGECRPRRWAFTRRPCHRCRATAGGSRCARGRARSP